MRVDQIPEITSKLKEENFEVQNNGENEKFVDIDSLVGEVSSE